MHAKLPPSVARPRSRSTAGSPTSTAELAFQVFESDLGWIAMAGVGDVLHWLVFGHSQPGAAHAELRELAGRRGWSLGSERGSESKADGGWNAPLAARLRRYAAGRREDFADVPVHVPGLSPFQERVNQLCREIPYGATLTYGRLADLAGSPGAARAVGNVMARNPAPLVVPCHRVVAAGGPGALGGYSASGGVRMKLRLLEAEARAGANGRS